MTSLLWLVTGLFGVLFVYSKQAASSAISDYPPLGRFVWADRVKMHYLDSAKDTAPADGRQTIILLHGASSNLRDFAISIFEPLARDFRVIAIDRPGHGYSQRMAENDFTGASSSGAGSGKWVNPANPVEQARLIHAALTGMGIRKPILAGHSWAGSVALAYALDYPQDIGGAVVLAGASQPWRSEPRFYNTWPAIPLWGDLFVNTLLAPGFQLSAETAIARNFFPNTPQPGYAHEAGLALLTRPDNWRANAEDMRKLSDFLVAQKKRYGEIQTSLTPITIITGDSDRSVSPETHAYKLHKQIAGSELVVLPGVGHMPHHAQPDKVVAAITELARKVAEIQGISGR